MFLIFSVLCVIVSAFVGSATKQIAFEQGNCEVAEILQAYLGSISETFLFREVYTDRRSPPCSFGFFECARDRT